MSRQTIWFSFEDEEAELHDVPRDTSVSTLRRRLHEGKIFRFPEGAAQTDLQIGRLVSDKFEKFKARNDLDDLNLKKDETLVVRVKKSKTPAVVGGVVPSIGASVPSANLTILQGSERAIKWHYDPYATAAQWIQTAVLVHVEQVPFAEGTFRQAFHCLDLGQVPSQNKYVAKISKKAIPREAYFEDVKMQMVARKWADKYNELKPPKQIGFLPSYVLELVDRQPEPVVSGVEPYVEGVYRKYNNNNGYVGDERNTPQSFSHFTYEHSNHQLLIVDIQGVGDHYTDPQIHTYDGVGFGQGNLGKQGFEKFKDSHQCNAICQYLELEPINPKMEKKDCGTFPRPELDLAALDTAPTTTKYTNTNVQGYIPALSKRKSWGDREREREREKEDLVQQWKEEALDWDFTTTKCTETLKAHTSAVGALCIADKNLYSGSADGTIKVWDLKTLESTASLRGHDAGVECLVANDQHLFSAAGDNTIKVWDMKRNRCTFTLEGHDKPVHILVIKDKYLFSGSADKTIKVWDLNALECISTLEGHNRAVKALCVSGQYLFSGSNDTTIKVWDLKNFRCNYTLRGHGKWVKALGIWGTDLYSGSYDKTIKVWSLKTLECKATIRGHERWVENMYISEGVLFSASDDNTIKIWRIGDDGSLKCVQTLEGHNGTVQSLAVSEPRRLLFSGSHDTTIKVWSWDTYAT